MILSELSWAPTESKRSSQNSLSRIVWKLRARVTRLSCVCFALISEGRRKRNIHLANAFLSSFKSLLLLLLSLLFIIAMYCTNKIRFSQIGYSKHQRNANVRTISSLNNNIIIHKRLRHTPLGICHAFSFVKQISGYATLCTKVTKISRIKGLTWYRPYLYVARSAQCLM